MTRRITTRILAVLATAAAALLTSGAAAWASDSWS